MTKLQMEKIWEECNGEDLLYKVFYYNHPYEEDTNSGGIEVDYVEDANGDDLNLPAERLEDFADKVAMMQGPYG